MSAPFDYSNLHAVPVADEAAFEPVEEPTIPDEHYDEPDPSLAKERRRPRNAAAYEKKVHTLLSNISTFLVQNDSTQPDAAAIYQYGGDMASAWGNLAADNDTVARAIDYLTEGSDNPVLAAAIATMPFVLQIVRNHEPELQPKPREISVPFTRKRMRFKVPFKVGVTLGRLHGMTHDPDEFTNAVLGNPTIAGELQKRGISVRKRGRDRG